MHFVNCCSVLYIYYTSVRPGRVIPPLWLFLRCLLFTLATYTSQSLCDYVKVTLKKTSVCSSSFTTVLALLSAQLNTRGAQYSQINLFCGFQFWMMLFFCISTKLVRTGDACEIISCLTTLRVSRWLWNARTLHPVSVCFCHLVWRHTLTEIKALIMLSFRLQVFFRDGLIVGSSLEKGAFTFVWGSCCDRSSWALKYI